MKRSYFVVSLITRDNDYQAQQAAAAEEAARRLNLSIETVYAENDAILQSQQILKFIQSDPDSRPQGVLVEPAGGTGLPQVARAAAAAGIGWVLMNKAPDSITELRRGYKAPMFAVSCDNEEVGQLQGRQLGALLPDGGSVLYIQGPAESTPTQLRTAGMYKTKPTNVQLKLMKAQWTEASAFKAVTGWLRLSTSRESHIDVITAQNDAMALGAKKAFKELPAGTARDHWLNLPYLGCDGTPAAGQSWVRSGLLTGTIVTPPLTGRALEMLVRALQTGVVPPEETLVTPTLFPALESLASIAKKSGATAGRPAKT